MVVDILDEGRSPESSRIAFLKLFDRRFADALRKDSVIEPWTKRIERDYIESVESGNIYRFLHNLRHVKNFQQDTEDDWNDAENEAFLAHELVRLHTAEVAVYDALSDKQGVLIPRLIASVNVELELPTPGDTRHRVGRDGFAPFRVKGILLEYLKGSSLLHIVDHFPRLSWQYIVDQAIAIVHTLDDHNILNDDVDPRNFLVCGGPDGCIQHNPQVFMIDFALCRFRAPNESDAEWGRAKHGMDEEGAVGLRMKKLLGENGFELRYKARRKYAQWADKDDSIPENAIKTELRPGVFMYYSTPARNTK